MTDNEIVKALRSWLEEIRKSRQAYSIGVGEEHYPSMKYEYLLTDAIREINRLQAENKRLTTLAELGNTRANDYRVMRDRALKAEAEIERLNKEVDRLSQVVLYNDGIIEMKVFEAYKEFVERLKEKYGYYDWENKTIVYPDEEIDNLLKELVGENDE